MLTLVAILGASFALCCLLTPLAGCLASRWGLIDQPDARRKLHGRPTPVAGGLAVLVSGSVVLGVAFLLNPLHDLIAAEVPCLLGLLVASLFLCAVGVLDDFGYLRGRH